jgi:hypothetical protein
VTYNQTLADYAENYLQACDFAHSGGPYGEVSRVYAHLTAAAEVF